MYVKGGYLWVINTKPQNSLKQSYRSKKKLFLICIFLVSFSCCKLIKKKSRISKSVLSLPYKINSLFTFKSSEIIVAECIYYA